MTLLMFDADTPSADGIFSGQILLGTLAERFGSTSGPWTPADYASHWKRSLGRALDGDDVALVTDWNPSKDPRGNSGRAWMLYWMTDDTVAIQQHLLLNENAFQSPASPNVDTIVVSPRRTRTDDGTCISEWTAKRGDIEALLQTLND